MPKYPDTTPLPSVPMTPIVVCDGENHAWVLESGGEYDFATLKQQPSQYRCVCGAAKEVEMLHDGGTVTTIFEPPQKRPVSAAELYAMYANAAQIIQQAPPLGIFMPGGPVAFPAAPEAFAQAQQLRRQQQRPVRVQRAPDDLPF